MKKLFFKHKMEELGFLRGWGLGETIRKVNEYKKKAFENRKLKTIEGTFDLLRLELYQIKKHQKITMRYINRLERLTKQKND